MEGSPVSTCYAVHGPSIKVLRTNRVLVSGDYYGSALPVDILIHRIERFNNVIAVVDGKRAAGAKVAVTA